ncbi:MAG TPA: signal recognition particle-docking protein FtsY, partial [Pseudomonadales bacterium]|nr:signal recognition particle-docking protein FtsY [Pseudomonadales bacterium]
QLSDRVARKQLADADALHAALRAALSEILQPVSLPLQIDDSKRPYVLLVIGVNGVGKTTTIGKLAKRYGQQGKKVMLAAGDTFRAAAVEQLKVWGERNQVPVVAQQSGADSASVLFDALSAAKARGIDLLIADTAGRLHNKAHLLEELKKVVRVLKKIDPEAPHEVLLVLDASTGQNALNQAQQFRDAVDVSGIALTKLDGTAKGGVIFAIAQQLGLPIRFIGVGEAIDDLRPFDADEFIRALFERDPA